MENKIAFVIHHASVYEHFQPIIEHLSAKSSVLLVEDRQDSLYGDQVADLVQRAPIEFQIRPLSETLSDGIHYKVVVSNHGYLRGLMSMLGGVRVRLMYGVDDAEWNYGPINEDFDLALTHGPYDTHQLQSRFGLPCYQIGYPKHAVGLSVEPTTHVPFRKTDAQRGRIAWLPTMHEHNSIPFFAKEFASLGTVADCVVKPHPMTFDQFPHHISLLEEAGCRVVLPTQSTTQDLIRSADITLHDFSSTVTAAIFSHKVPMLLEVPPSQTASAMLSGDILARQRLGVVNRGKLKSSVLNRLALGRASEADIRTCAALRASFFADLDGHDAEVAAGHLQRILRQPMLLSKVAASKAPRIGRRALSRSPGLGV